MVVNYQTWGDPFAVILALPATFCGMDDRHPSVPRNFRGNRCRIAPDRHLAGA